MTHATYIIHWDEYVTLKQKFNSIYIIHSSVNYLPNNFPQTFFKFDPISNMSSAILKNISIALILLYITQLVALKLQTTYWLGIKWLWKYLKSADGFHLQIDGLVQDCSNASALPIE